MTEYLVSSNRQFTIYGDKMERVKINKDIYYMCYDMIKSKRAADIDELVNVALAKYIEGETNANKKSCEKVCCEKTS